MSVHYDGLAGEYPTRKNLSSVAQGIAAENNGGRESEAFTKWIAISISNQFFSKRFL